MANKLYKQLPWTGGLNTSEDESMISGNQLITADNVQFDTRGSRKKREGINHNYDSIALTGVSVANPTVITAAAHGLTTGDVVVISGTATTPSINGSYTATVTGTGTFTIPVDVTATTDVTGTLYTNSARNIVGMFDYWYGTGTSRTQKLVAVTSDGKVFSYNSSGTRTAIVVTAAYTTTPITKCSMTTIGNILIIAVDGASNVMKYWDGTNAIENVPGTPPLASIVSTHLGRIICNDKTAPDRLYYSPTEDYTLWNGAGDSGALDISTGDGDPVGINAIFPTFKGNLFVAKKTKLYRITGYTPETLQIVKVSDGIGCVSHQSIAPIDQDDIFFVSERGVHSLAATDQYGDFSSTYVSIDIQKTFNDDFNRARLQFVHGSYLSNINCVAFTFSLEGSSQNDQLYLYHIPTKAWHRYTTISCQSLVISNDSDKRRFYIGTASGRISKTLNGTVYDIDNSGTNTAIDYRITTGLIYLNPNAYTFNTIKRFVLYYKPTGVHTVTCTIRCDELDLNDENAIAFTHSSSLQLLGSTFTLGSSLLGITTVTAPSSRMIDGQCRAIKLYIEQTGIQQEVEIQGFAIEYEELGYAESRS